MPATALPPVKSELERLRFVRFATLENWSPSASTGNLGFHASVALKPLGYALRVVRHPVIVQDELEYMRVKVRIHGKGACLRDRVTGKSIKTKRQFRVEAGQLVMSRIDARNGAFGLIPDELDGAIVTNDFPVFAVRKERMLPDYLRLVLGTPQFRDYCQTLSKGTTNRQRMDEGTFLSIPIPFPDLDEQEHLVRSQGRALMSAEADEARAREAADRAVRFLEESLGLKPRAEKVRLAPNKLHFVRFAKLERWGEIIDGENEDKESSVFPIVSGNDCLLEVKHGCSASPSVSPTGLEVLKISAVTRGELDISQRKHIPNVNSYRIAFSLLAGDVLMCRTNGTLNYVGMSALVESDMADLIYPDKVIRVRVDPNKILPEFFWLVSQSWYLRKQIERVARTTAGNYAIGGKDIWNFQFPLPPLADQTRIVAELDRLRSEARAARSNAAASREAAAKSLEADLFAP